MRKRDWPLTIRPMELVALVAFLLLVAIASVLTQPPSTSPQQSESEQLADPTPLKP